MLLGKKEVFQNVRRLSIAKQNKFNCVYELVKHLRKYPNLQYLQVNLKKNRESLWEFCEEVQNNSNLVELNLDLTQNYMNPDKMSEFAQNISKCQRLHQLTLNLFDNQAGVDGTDQLFSGLSQMQQLQSLNIDLRSNKILSCENRNIFSSNYEFKCLQNLHINLGDNQITSYLLNSLLDLVMNISTLENFNLNLMCSSQSEEQLKFITNRMSKQYPINLTKVTIDLNSNIIGINQNGSIENLDLDIEIQNLSIIDLSLNLNSNFIKENDLHIIQLFIQKYPNLQIFNLLLDGNQLSNQSIQIIVEMLTKIQSLEQLKFTFSNNNLSFESPTSIMNIILANMTQLKSLELDQSWNSILQIKDTQTILQKQYSSSLEFLTLKLDQLDSTQESTILLFQDISQLKRLKQLQLYLDGNIIIFTNELMKYLTQLQNLNYLKLVLDKNFQNVEFFHKKIKLLKRLVYYEVKQ